MSEKTLHALILVLLFCVFILAGVATEYIHKKEHKPEQTSHAECKAGTDGDEK